MRRDNGTGIGLSAAAVATVVLLGSAADVSAAAPQMERDSMPVVVQTEPQAGLTDVDPATVEIRVTFSKPMRDGAWSWVRVSPESFPRVTGPPRFLTDRRTCVLPVSLEPDKAYAVWINQPLSSNFQDQNGHKAVPYLLMFQTRKRSAGEQIR